MNMRLKQLHSIAKGWAVATPTLACMLPSGSNSIFTERDYTQNASLAFVPGNKET
jgi:hypothetical protein